VGPAELPAQLWTIPIDHDVSRAQSEPVVHLTDNRCEPGITDAEVTEHHFVYRQRVGTRIHVTDVGRAVTPHDAERPIGDRRPRVDDGEVRRRRIEQHHGG
jgi:hypothetical protein